MALHVTQHGAACDLLSLLNSSWKPSNVQSLDVDVQHDQAATSQVRSGHDPDVQHDLAASETPQRTS